MKTTFQIKQNPDNHLLFYPVIEGLEGYRCDYLTDRTEESLDIIRFLYKFNSKNKIDCLKQQHSKNKIKLFGKDCENKNYSLQSQFEPILEYNSKIGLLFELKRCHDYDPLSIALCVDKELLYFYTGFSTSLNELNKKNSEIISVKLFLYLYEWWDNQEKIECTGELELPQIEINRKERKKFIKELCELLNDEIRIIKSLFSDNQYEYNLINEYQQFISKYDKRRS